MTSHSTTDTGRDDPFMGSQPGEWTTLVAQMVKNPPAMLVRPLGWEDPRNINSPWISRLLVFSPKLGPQRSWSSSLLTHP